MNKKMWLAGLLAGVVMFVWGFIAHDILPFGQMALKTTPTEDAVMASIKSNVNTRGMYVLPGNDMTTGQKLSGDQKQAAMKAYMDKWSAGPRAIVVYSDGAAPGFGMLLGRQFLAIVFAGLIMAFALSAALPTLKTFVQRVIFVTLIGLLPWFVVDIPFWNWYQFPADYAISQVLCNGIGGLLGGIFLAWFYRKEGTTQPSLAKAA